MSCSENVHINPLNARIHVSLAKQYFLKLGNELATYHNNAYAHRSNQSILAM